METTSTRKDGARRSYEDGCAAAHALDLVGERWVLLVVRELVLGPKRFTDLMAGLPGVSTNILSERLRGLEGAGIVRRRTLPPPAASKVYELTEWGSELEDIIVRLGRWGVRSPSKPKDDAIGVDALVLSFRTMFDAGAAEGLEAAYELGIGEDRFRARVSGGRFEITRGSAERPDATVEADPGTLAGLVYGDRHISDALGSGDLRIRGDRGAVERFLTLFPLPEPVAPVVGT